jgi:hypothetical protein
MATVEVPAGVGVASLAVVGNTARVMLRSDCRFLCVACGLSPTVIGDADSPVADWSAYWHDVRRQGVVRLLLDAAGRQYPEFIWHRGRGVTVAPWTDKGDPDGAIGILAEAIRHVGRTMDRGFGYSIDERVARVAASEAIRRMRYKGYVVVPEWMSRAKPATTGTTRGARVFDFGDEETA